MEVTAQQGEIHNVVLELYDANGNFVKFGEISGATLRTSFVALTTGSHYVKLTSDSRLTYTITPSVQY